MKNKTTIMVETWKRTMIRQGEQTIIAWCESCAVETKMISPDEAARFFGTTARRIYRRSENGDFHFVETQNGMLLICNNSIQENTNTRRLKNGI